MICINKLSAKQRNAPRRCATLRSVARRCAALRGAARRRAVPRSAALRTAAQRCAQCECCLEQTLGDHPPRKISIRFDYVGGQFATVRFLSLLFWSLRHAHRSHRWTDFDDLCVIWRPSPRMCLLGVSLICLPFRGQILPQKTISGTWIGVIQRNWWNRKTCILSKLLRRFPPNFAQW